MACRTRPHAPAPPAPLARALPVNAVPRSPACPSLHPLKVRSLRQTQGGSVSMPRAMVSQRASTVLGACFLRKALSLAKAISIGLKRSEEHTSELQSLMRISYAVFCLKKKKLHQYRLYN